MRFFAIIDSLPLIRVVDEMGSKNDRIFNTENYIMPSSDDYDMWESLL